MIGVNKEPMGRLGLPRGKRQGGLEGLSCKEVEGTAHSEASPDRGMWWQIMRDEGNLGIP